MEGCIVIMKIVRFWGGLGNQLFQYAFLKALEESNCLVKGDISFYNKYVQHNGFELEKIFKIHIDKASLEECFRAGDKNELYYQHNCWNRFIYKIFYKYGLYNRSDIISAITFCDDFKGDRNRYYKGYWSSEKYFKNISRKIRDFFVFPDLDEKNLEVAKQIKSNNSVSLHIRRGDYLNSGNEFYQNCCTGEYYKNAVNFIESNFRNSYYYVFSNDIDWCRNNLNLVNACYIDWNKGENSYRDMQLMSLCKHNIIANSTFSWWGAWLNDNPNKMVLVPAKWFDLPNCSVDDIYPEDWIRIPTK